ncbi:hypothetical protein SS50377_24051 [Spironucleus salmonicida]|uniref:Cilia- and flagella-associated protein 299 n=1 Tax=Spironucleus salmonicida TaxID=348837 RepID=V6M0R8_9EUKA|nr:hypothetical protein SS50377_24051 [Spironucleus salmonicida]|eukprot:EST46719.1 hypothetical protein SS50377_13261 [Spironucleus salmonicida]
MAESNFNLLEIVHKFKTYEEYLDSHIKPEDLFFLNSLETARRIVETSSLKSEILKRDEFESAKREINSQKQRGQSYQTTNFASDGANVDEFPFLFALKQREQLVKEGKLAVIVFLRDKNHSGQEISGYIDYGQRLKNEDCRGYFLRQKKLLPKSTDLSFYNWDTQFVSSMASENFELMADNEAGFLFKCRRDRKVINVNPGAVLDEKSVRHVIDTHEYVHCVIYDHVLRRKM